jgi:hypothetical protein
MIKVGIWEMRGRRKGFEKRGRPLSRAKDDTHILFKCSGKRN